MAKNNSYRSQEFLSFLLVLGELPNFIIVTALAITAKSLVVWMDFIDSAGNLLRAFFVLFLSHKLRKDLKYTYNYGVGKVEAMSSLCCDIILMVSIGAMGFAAIRQLIFGPDATNDALGFAVIFKVFCVAGDAFMFFKQRIICKQNPTNLVFRAELSMRIKNLVFDSSTFIALLLIWLFRGQEWAAYFSPVVCIILAVYLLYGLIQRIREAFREMLDKTAGETVQKAVLSALTAEYQSYESFDSVHSHISGGTVFIDLWLDFRDDMSYREIRDFVDRVHARIKDKVPDCLLTVQIRSSDPTPASPAVTSGDAEPATADVTVPPASEEPTNA